MNISDSEVAISILRRAGYERCKEIADADVILINTCSVRDNAEMRVLGRLDVFMQEKKKRKQKSKKSKAPDGSAKQGPVIGVLGCMGQRLKEKLLENPAVDFVAGPDTYRNLPDVIKAIIDNGEKISATNLSAEPRNDICCDCTIRKDFSYIGNFLKVFFSGVFPVHLLQHCVASALYRKMNMIANI